MMRFGLSTTVFGAARLGPRELELVATHRFDLIDLAVRPGHFDVRDPTQVSAVQALASSFGLEIGSVTIALADASLGLHGTVDLGCPLLVALADGCRAHGSAPRAADINALRRDLDHVVDHAVEKGIAIAVEFPATLSPDEIAALIESLEGAPIGVCLDVGHAHLAGGAPEAIEALSGYVQAVHLHDNQSGDDGHRPPYAGSVDWPATLMALWKTGYAGPGLFEIAPDSDAAAALARVVGARTRLQAILDDLAQPMIFPE